MSNNEAITKFNDNFPYLECLPSREITLVR